MKKLISFLLIALVFTGLLVSCSSSASDTEVISKEKAAEEAKAEITEENVEKAADDLLKELEAEAK